jgi:hypothetical protein
MDKNIHTKMTEQILRSQLLLPQQREALLAHLEKLTSAQQTQLASLLDTEKETLNAVNADCIAIAAKRGNKAFFGKLDALIITESRAMRKAQEAAEKSDDDKTTEHMFTDAA